MCATTKSQLPTMKSRVSSDEWQRLTQHHLKNTLLTKQDKSENIEMWLYAAQCLITSSDIYQADDSQHKNEDDNLLWTKNGCRRMKYEYDLGVLQVRTRELFF